MLDFAIFAITFLAVLLIAIIWIYPSSKKVTTIPGLDPSTSEDGNLSDIARAGSLHEFLVEIHERFGPITGFWWGQTYVVSIASPDLFKDHSNVSDKPSELFKLFESVWGPLSIQSVNGSEWRKRRQFYDSAFEHNRLISYYEHFQKISHSVEKNWLQKTEHDHIPLSEEMFKYSIRATLINLLGESFNDEKMLLSVRNAYDKAWSEIEHRLTDPTIPDENSPRTKQLDEALQYLKSTIKKLLELQGKDKKTQGQFLINSIAELNTNEDIICSDAIAYVIGGFQTAANLLTWCIYFLATHKDVQTKLHSELIEVLGENKDVDSKTYGQLVYLNQVINETLRCAVVAPWTARYQDFDTELGGHKIPKNTPVIHSLGVVLQDQTLWPLPNKFDPDRFSVEESKKRSAYAFSPFGFAGKRKCPGNKFAYIEATVLLSTLIRRFEVSLCDEQVAQPVYGLVTHPLDEIWVKVSKR